MQEIEYNVLKIDGYESFEAKNPDFTYSDDFIGHPILLSSKGNFGYIQEKHEAFYQARSEYLEMFDFSCAYLLVFTVFHDVSLFGYEVKDVGILDDEMIIVGKMNAHNGPSDDYMIYTNVILQVYDIQDIPKTLTLVYENNSPARNYSLTIL